MDFAPEPFIVPTEATPCDKKKSICSGKLLNSNAHVHKTNAHMHIFFGCNAGDYIDITRETTPTLELHNISTTQWCCFTCPGSCFTLLCHFTRHANEAGGRQVKEQGYAARQVATLAWERVFTHTHKRNPCPTVKSARVCSSAPGTVVKR